MQEGPAPAWDRFATWPPVRARLLLAVVVVLVALSAITPITEPPGDRASVSTTAANGLPKSGGAEFRDDDLALYDRAIERVGAGEYYYDFIVEEQRARDYPVRPGVAVRLPTLAYIHAALGENGMLIAAILAISATLWAWWQRLRDETGSARIRRFGTALVLLGCSLGFNRYYFVLHELWAGILLGLAFGLHRPGRWGWSLAVAALALAIREHVLPFVMLMGAMAAWRRDWKEALAWSTLVLIFFAFMTWHLAQVTPHVFASDRESPDWLVLRGLAGWLGNFVLASNLRFLPHFIAAPLALLMILGWAGWKSPAGVTGTFLFLGYGLAFMLASRANNFYWGAVVGPALFIGAAFLPTAFISLWRSARLSAPGR